MSSFHTRKSTRIKKLIYGTLNQTLLGKHLITRAILKTRPLHSNVKYHANNNIYKRKDHEIHEAFHLHSSNKKTRLSKEIYNDIIKNNESDLSTQSSDEVEDLLDADEEREDEDERDETKQRSYYLREHKPLTQKFEVSFPGPKPHRNKYYAESNAYKSRVKNRANKSLEDKIKSKHLIRRSCSLSDSSSSVSSLDSINDKRFRRKERNKILKARRRCLPLNFTLDDVSKNYVMKDRLRIGRSMADIEPMTIDKNVWFDDIGGLKPHVQCLKEMVLFPLLYPSVLQGLDITPPRGVLFYGPPGTGKTLLAKALVNECSNIKGTTYNSHGSNSKNDAKISFFMRKGSDCLSKWVGESERQLRLLFDQAYKMRPSIIFFDEIDGLAPVRSSRQEQIHNSIVSTFLALLDGLDSRSSIVVIGATNRLDAIDPAFRRPGRFDREFLFPMPNRKVREKIFRIHTQKWQPPLEENLFKELALQTTGFTGADIKGLCTEASLIALRHKYPHIYTSNQRLDIDVQAIKVKKAHFAKAFKVLIPSTLRHNKLWTRDIPHSLKPLLNKQLTELRAKITQIFPPTRKIFGKTCTSEGEESHDSDSDDAMSRSSSVASELMSCLGNFKDHESKSMRNPFKSHTFRPRIILTGPNKGAGQTSYLAPALLNDMDGIPVNVIDVTTLYGSSFKMAEETCNEIFREAQRLAPSVIYLPRMNEWWSILSETTKTAFTTLVNGLPTNSPILLMATSDFEYESLPETIKEFFDDPSHVYHVSCPDKVERKDFFSCLLKERFSDLKSQYLKRLMYPSLGDVPNVDQNCHLRGRDSDIMTTTKNRKTSSMTANSFGPTTDIRKLTPRELIDVRESEENTLRELRIFLRDVLSQLTRDRKFQSFAKPVNPREVPDYYVIVKSPMDLSEMRHKIDSGSYPTPSHFLSDIELVCRNALEYNPDHTPTDKLIRHRACSLLDEARSAIYKQLEPAFAQLCQDIEQSRRERGEKVNSLPPFLTVPSKDMKDQIFSSYYENIKYDPIYRSRKLNKKNNYQSPSHENTVIKETRLSLKSKKNCNLNISSYSPHLRNQELVPKSFSNGLPENGNDLVRTPLSNDRAKDLTKNAKIYLRKQKKISIWCKSSRRRRFKSKYRRPNLNEGTTVSYLHNSNTMLEPITEPMESDIITSTSLDNFRSSSLNAKARRMFTRSLKTIKRENDEVNAFKIEPSKIDPTLTTLTPKDFETIDINVERNNDSPIVSPSSPRGSSQFIRYSKNKPPSFPLNFYRIINQSILNEVDQKTLGDLEIQFLGLLDALLFKMVEISTGFNIDKLEKTICKISNIAKTFIDNYLDQLKNTSNKLHTEGTEDGKNVSFEKSEKELDLIVIRTCLLKMECQFLKELEPDLQCLFS
ncbi:unnamed protein product [Gordionus sp. m RMFG-2023]|uniref:ATPase family AAA domain-containing protein 2-like n=1 Tax=Gordionus sp. m RMFG-2023 TaxID=3053472 RepID=UPI0030DFCE43